MQITQKYYTIDLFIIVLIMGITIVDSLNGFLITQGWFSFSKPYKFLVLVLMVLRLTLTGRINKYSLLLFFSFASFFTGYVIYFVFNLSFNLLLRNLIESIKYFIWPISFIYFKNIYSRSNKNLLKYILLAINVSYVVVFINIVIGILGYGYVFYRSYNTGTKGFFYSGNEFSLLFLLLTYIVGWRIFKKSKIKYFFFTLLSLFLAVKIGSKTAILGVFLFSVFTSISNVNFLKLSVKKIAFLFFSAVATIFVSFFLIKMNERYVNGFILKRLEAYNYDLVTWFLSKRNLVAIDGYEIFIENNLFFRIFGQGEVAFQQKFRIIELDFVDLLMNHGYLGLVSYLFFIVVVFFFLYKNQSTSPFNKFIFYTFILVMIFLSNMSGHIINTGIPGFFIGMIFSMPFLERGFYEE
ncbi:hypothetical protein [Cellulophaga fucicola]|uniref:hypothetical protein n=1 Tax=Cellulophaga fucicola TaxID=76595 RepID=UPI003EB79710